MTDKELGLEISAFQGGGGIFIQKFVDLNYWKVSTAHYSIWTVI